MLGAFSRPESHPLPRILYSPEILVIVTMDRLKGMIGGRKETGMPPATAGPAGAASQVGLAVDDVQSFGRVRLARPRRWHQETLAAAPTAAAPHLCPTPHSWPPPVFSQTCPCLPPDLAVNVTANNGTYQCTASPVARVGELFWPSHTEVSLLVQCCCFRLGTGRCLIGLSCRYISN